MPRVTFRQSDTTGTQIEVKDNHNDHNDDNVNHSIIFKMICVGVALKLF